MVKTIDEIINSPRRPVVIAHRGASFYYHENTMEAFEAAVEMRAEMVELDVRRTKDRILVVHHDPYVAGSEIGAVSKIQIDDASKSSSYSVPSLEEVLEYCKDRVPVDIELKEAGYEEQVLETVLTILGPEQFLVSSSHDMVVLKVKTLRPEIRTGLVLYRASFPGLLRQLFPAARVRLTGVDFVMVSEKLLRLGFLGLNKKLEKPVWVYTVNERKRLWELAADERIDGVFTDRPDVALFIRDLQVVGKYQESGEGNSSNVQRE